MKTFDVCLRLLVPLSLSEKVTDCLLAQPSLCGPFIAYGVDGHGNPEAIQQAAEAVRGSTRRIQVEVLTCHADAEALLATLRDAFPRAPVTYWLAPVLAAGSLT